MAERGDVAGTEQGTGSFPQSSNDALLSNTANVHSGKSSVLENVVVSGCHAVSDMRHFFLVWQLLMLCPSLNASSRSLWTTPVLPRHTHTFASTNAFNLGNHDNRAVTSYRGEQGS